MIHGPTFTGRYYRYSNLLMVVAHLLEATVGPPRRFYRRRAQPTQGVLYADSSAVKGLFTQSCLVGYHLIPVYFSHALL